MPHSVGPKYRSPEWRARTGIGTKRGHERSRTATIAALDFLRRKRVALPELRPLVALAPAELGGWIEGLGGDGSISPMRRSLLEDAAILGTLMRAEVAKYLATREPEHATRAATLANSRRANLIAAGLDAPAPEEIPVDDLIGATLGDRAGDAISAPDGSHPASTPGFANGLNDASAAHAHEGEEPPK